MPRQSRIDMIYHTVWFNVFPIGQAIVRNREGRDQLEKFERRIQRWKYVVEVEFGHANFVSCDFESRSAAATQRRAEKMRARLEKLLLEIEER